MVSSDVLIRPAISKDAVNFTALSIQVWLDTYATDGLRDDLAEYVLKEFTLETSLNTINDSDQRVLIAELNGHIIGYIQTKIDNSTELHSSVRQAEVSKLYVQEPFTRKGIGRALMSEIEQRLLEEKIELVWLTAWVGNTRARSFYSSIGYEDVGRTDWIEGGKTYENRVFIKPLSL
jgi:diamine N-acetyltransferase